MAERPVSMDETIEALCRNGCTRELAIWLAALEAEVATLKEALELSMKNWN